MKDKDGLYDEGDGIYKPSVTVDGKPYKAKIRFYPKHVDYMNDRYYLDPKEVQKVQKSVLSKVVEETDNVPVKYFINGEEVRQSDIDNYRDKLTHNYAKHKDGFNEEHYSETPWYQLPTDQAREKYNKEYEEYWKEKEERYRKWKEVTPPLPREPGHVFGGGGGIVPPNGGGTGGNSTSTYTGNTQRSNFDNNFNWSDWWKNDSWNEKARQIEREQALLKEEQTKNLMSNLQRLQKEVMVLTEKVQKLTNENVDLKRKVELFEKDPSEYQRRMKVDPYGEENWEK